MNFLVHSESLTAFFGNTSSQTARVTLESWRGILTRTVDPYVMLNMAAMADEELIRQLIPLWHAERAWAEELIKRCLKLDSASKILPFARENPGTTRFPGTNWMFRTHGIGVDIYCTPDSGGIDFDFDKREPDAWRIKLFLQKQLNSGALCHSTYLPLWDDEDRLEAALKAVFG